MPSQPHTLPQETLGADYWQVALSAPDDATARLLKPLGLDGLADQYRKGNPAPIDEYPELAEMMAIQSREIHFKHECLMDAFEADGYRVSTFEPLPEEHQKAIAGELRELARLGTETFAFFRHGDAPDAPAAAAVVATACAVD